MLSKICLAAASLAAIGSAAEGALVITEVMSSSKKPTPDWVEITNTGETDETIAGFRIDDNSFSFAASLTLNGITSIPAGKSAVFMETDQDTVVADFKTYWSLASDSPVGSYNGSGIGFSSNGDSVVLFTDTGAELTRVTFGAATSGSSFGYNPSTRAFGDVSTSGNFGAYTTTSTPSDIGSPLLVPEPGNIAALGLMGLLALRRRPR